MLCTFTIDDEPFEVEVTGDFFPGEDKVLFSEKGSVIEDCEWTKSGFTTVPIANDKAFQDLKDNIWSILLSILKGNNIPVDEHFSLEHYHRYVTTAAWHQSVIEKTRFLRFSDFHIDMDHLMEQFSGAVGKPLQRTNPLLPEEIIIMRISRPDSLDINPFHRDGYLDIWEKVLNVWIPVAGCNSASSLPVLPGSHYWNEKDIIRTAARGASINGLNYNVPAIVSYKDGLHARRPNPKYGEALLFTPFLIHGAALNRQPDTTRVSLELRLYHEG
ncbi:MAG TPA: phytanoyl-CoA dioxygenase family protein [Panacibacter sp.]|nr:phytanoyl-CoA dioxygenase family protein [Panacibacter sp.]HNP46534.1 phytanoyl-CoA dioxygenase family protein [Panacibacter sp.]